MAKKQIDAPSSAKKIDRAGVIKAAAAKVWPETFGSVAGTSTATTKEAVAASEEIWHGQRQKPSTRIARLQAPESEESTKTAWREAFSKMLAEVPVDYAGFRIQASAISHCFREQLAKAMEPRLNQYLRTLPSETYAEKQSLSSWVNGQLHDLGLAIRCPRTQRPAILVADVQGGQDSVSRFRLEIRTDSGQRTKTLSARQLPSLELMEDEIRIEPIAKRNR